MGELLHALAATVPLWRLPLIAVLFGVIVLCLCLVHEIYSDD